MLPQTDGNRRPLLRPPRAAMYQMKPGKLLGWWVAGVLAKRGVWHGACGTNSCGCTRVLTRGYHSGYYGLELRGGDLKGRTAAAVHGVCNGTRKYFRREN